MKSNIFISAIAVAILAFGCSGDDKGVKVKVENPFGVRPLRPNWSRCPKLSSPPVNLAQTGLPGEKQCGGGYPLTAYL